MGYIITGLIRHTGRLIINITTGMRFVIPIINIFLTVTPHPQYIVRISQSITQTFFFIKGCMRTFSDHALIISIQIFIQNPRILILLKQIFHRPVLSLVCLDRLKSAVLIINCMSR